MATDFHKHPAHPPPVRRHNEPVIVHVTVAVFGKRRILANDHVHEVLAQVWHQATHWLTGYYLVMPDHVHLFCGPGVDTPLSIRRWAGYWKRLAGEVEPALKRQFQEDCWDTQTRSQEHYLRKLEYVRSNPVRWGLVRTPEEWPFQGNLHPLPWI
jgi:putative transposase